MEELVLNEEAFLYLECHGFRVGRVVKANVIGLGFYNVVSFNAFHINMECLKLFGQGAKDRGHVTNLHKGKGVPMDYKAWLEWPWYPYLEKLALSGAVSETKQDGYALKPVDLSVMEAMLHWAMLTNNQEKVPFVDIPVLGKRLYNPYLKNRMWLTIR